MLRHLTIALAAFAVFPLAACDQAEPIGLFPGPAKKVVPPLELTGRVVDEANLLSDAEEASLTVKLATIEDDKLAQMVVVTTPDLQGYSIADYSLALGRGWGIGDAERNDGLLLVVAPNERKVRIEVGYGLETTVEDPEAAEVIRSMKPFLEKSDFSGAISLGVKLLESELREPSIKEAA